MSIRICLWKPQRKIIPANWIPKLCFLMITVGPVPLPPPPVPVPVSWSWTWRRGDGTDLTPIFIFTSVKFRHDVDKRLQPGGVSRPASARLLPTFPDREAGRGRGGEGGGRRQMTRGHVSNLILCLSDMISSLKGPDIKLNQRLSGWQAAQLAGSASSSSGPARLGSAPARLPEPTWPARRRQPTLSRDLGPELRGAPTPGFRYESHRV